MEEPSKIINAIADEYGPALSYNYFSTEEVRKLYRNSGGTIKDLVRLLVAYISIGNNHGSLITKVQNSSKGREILMLLKKYQISERTTGKDSSKLTLPRLASAFAPFLINLRIKMLDLNLIQDQISTDTPRELQDISLNMADSTQDYCEKFALLITNKDRRGIKKNLTEDQIIKEVKFYSQLAKEGLDKDLKLKNMLIDYKNNDNNRLMDLFNN